MDFTNRIIASIVFCGLSINGIAQTLTGCVVGKDDRKPIAYASVTLKENRLYAFTDEKGCFTIKNVPKGKCTAVISCLGYAEQTIVVTINNDGATLNVRLAEDNLQLDEVQVVAHRKKDEITTSYTIDRKTLDNQQIMTLGDIAQLLPGGKSVNPSLMNDGKLTLRSGSSERGNASFGTAIEVDGVRLNNNAMMGETAGVSTRGVSASNIESVEIVPGIASVEYGDLTNGVVKVKTRRGSSPFILEGSINQHTRQIALHKGLDLGKNAGLINFSLEHARSFSDAASPYTAYQRNVLSLHYMNVFMKKTQPLTLDIGLNGGVGGYDSKADPDRNLDSYYKVKDNNVGGNVRLDWLLNKSWITNLNFTAAFTYADKRSESYSNESSSSTQPYIHTLTEGYNIAEDYDKNPSANIILGPTGYWYLRGFGDSKPLTYSLKLKANWNKSFGKFRNRLLVGAEWTSSRNKGKGTHYEDMRYAPTWREYRFDVLPALNNMALYAEDKLSMAINTKQNIELTAGVREDITSISGSEYGTVGSFSPRVNMRYMLRFGQDSWVNSLSVHSGWGKSVKLPSFQVLYPSPSYRDMLAFSSTSDANNRSYYAYYTHPSKARYNADLKWQYANQWDLGVELRTKIADINLSFFHSKTFNPYMATNTYTPFTYKYTSPAKLQASGIDAANRLFTIDPQTGIVTVSDASGAKTPVVLGYDERNTYVTNTKYVNANPLSRYGLEWIVDFKQIKTLRTQVRVDGKYYHYKAQDETLFADVPVSLNTRQSDGKLYQYIGYYRGGAATSTNYTANASPSNGSVSGQVDMNVTLTTHIPKIRLVVALRMESSLYTYSRATSSRGYVVSSGNEYFGEAYNGKTENQTVIVYPEYYSTWDAPETLVPFAEKLRWAATNDRGLYNDLAQLVVRTNYPYTLNPNKLSAFWSANLSVTKEIGKHVSISFYANNFFNTLAQVHSSQTGLETSLFGSGYVPSFYYGLSLRLKI
nr:TonB-dependent receptor [uncultured Prevotella sp.]